MNIQASATAANPTPAIYVIDDHPLMRAALVMVLRKMRPNTEIVELEKLDTIMSDVKRKGEPILFCLDLKIPNTNGAEGVAKLRRLWPKVPLAVYSAEPAAVHEEACIAAGADTYIEKISSMGTVTEILGGLLSANEEEAPAEEAAGEELTNRQLELLLKLDKGLSNRELATEMGISEHTVKVHLWRMMRKLGAKSRVQALHVARNRGLIDGA